MHKRQAFTLIETVVALILLGIVGLAFFTSLTYGIQQYLTSSSEAALAQKALLSLTRMHVELTEIENIDAANQDIISNSAFYYLDHNGNAGSLALGNGSIIQNGQFVLVDEVSTYKNSQELFTYTDKAGNPWTPDDGFDDLSKINILLVLDSPWDTPNEFTHTVNPRHTLSPNAPKMQ